jgi:HPt (histidine-containing phosphotransfer) domain-containing protein
MAELVRVPRWLLERVTRYIARARARLPILFAHNARGEWDELAQQGHNLKGSGGAFGFDRISHAGTRLEQAARAKDATAARAVLEELQAYLEGIDIISE